MPIKERFAETVFARCGSLFPAEVETLNRKLQELTEEELEQVTGGSVNLASKFAGIRCDDNAVRKGLQSASSKFEDLSD